jgi:hypothetical protein
MLASCHWQSRREQPTCDARQLHNQTRLHNILHTYLLKYVKFRAPPKKNIQNFLLSWILKSPHVETLSTMVDSDADDVDFSNALLSQYVVLADVSSSSSQHADSFLALSGPDGHNSTSDLLRGGGTRTNASGSSFKTMGTQPPLLCCLIPGLGATLLKAIARKGYKNPTPIQRKTIPPIMAGRDVVGMARTGSGKTVCFIVPMIEKLKIHSAKVCFSLVNYSD